MSRFFLGRNQKTFGPLSGEEIDNLRKSGQLAAYTWIFKEGDAQWSPIDPPPALPGQAVQIAASTPSTARARPVPALRLVQSANIPPDTFRVILFDHRNAISGWLIGANEGGCEIMSDQNASDPLFVAKEAACLSLHDTRTGETIKLRVRVFEVLRASGRAPGWSYRLHWEAIPSLLRHSNRGESQEVAA